MKVADVELRHGYTLADVNRLSRQVAAGVTGMSISRADAFDDAWSTIVEMLYESEHFIPPAFLMRRAQIGLFKGYKDQMHEDGVANRDYFNGAGSAPRYVMYWYRPVTSFEDEVVEQVAMAQIWPMLGGIYQEAIVAMAIYAGHIAAAKSLGITQSAQTMRIATARSRFLALWHEHETATKVWGFNHPGNGGLGKHRRPSAVSPATDNTSGGVDSREENAL